MKPTTAVVILNWNGTQWLEKFLPSVVTHSSEAKIYVIDNHSDDDSVVFLQKNFPTIKIVQNDKNYGFAGGYNVGLRKIEAEYYCLLNSDVEVTENWILPVIELFETHPEIAAIKDQLYSQGATFSLMSGSGSTVYGLIHKEQEIKEKFAKEYFVKLVNL